MPGTGALDGELGAEPPEFFENNGSIGHRIIIYLRGLPTGNRNLVIVVRR